MSAPLPCIICNATLQTVEETAYNQPYGGTTFTTHGHYGSTVFDPMNGEYLELNVCDPCLRDLATKQLVLIARNRKPIMHDGSLIGWTPATRWPVPWSPDMEADDATYEVDSWEEWQSLAADGKATSWLPDDDLQDLLTASREEWDA